MREFTTDELARYDGRAGAAAYIACNGKVYDVSRSFLWQQGRHQALHKAGADLTEELMKASHGADLLARVPFVGSLVQQTSEDEQEKGGSK